MLDNFDIIPTGGIKRRNGNEQVSLLENSGRLIPFFIDRYNHCFLYLTDSRIKVIKLVYTNDQWTKIECPAIDNIEGEPLYTGGEIKDVQFSQNFNVLALTHKNHHPFEIKLQSGELVFEKIKMIFKMTVETTISITDEEKATYENEDDPYNEGWLQNGKCPVAVTYYNNRIVFANIEGCEQRIFVSAIKKEGQPYNFATKKIFLTERKEYVTVAGKPIEGGKYIELVNSYEKLVFHKDIPCFICDSVIYPPHTYPIKFTDFLTLEMSKPIDTDAVLTNEEEIMLKENIEGIENAELNPFFFDFGPAYLPSLPGTVKPNYGVRIYPTKIIIEQRDPTFKITKNISEQNTKDIISAGWEYISNRFLSQEIIAPILEMIHDYWDDNATLDMWRRQVAFRGDLDELSFQLMHFIGRAMRLNFRNKVYYGDPHDIIRRVRSTYIDKEQVITVPFYTREIIEDRYPTPDDGFTFEIASDKSDAIRWLALNKGIIVGTEMAEWILPPGINATNIQAQLNSRYGSDKIQGTAINDATCFFQAGKKSLVEYYIPQQDNNFRANNMAMLNPEMLSESPAVEFDYVTSPYTKLFITREKGDVVTLLYERGTGTFAWGRLTTDGKILSVAVLPGEDGNDDVYMAVKRGEQVFLEVLREAGEVYLDSYVKTSAESWAEDIAGYDAGKARVSRISRGEDGTARYEQLPADAEPDWSAGGEVYIGYPYTSVMRTMPVLANNQMKKQRITGLIFRFLESWLPKVTSLAGGRAIKTDVITGVKAPFSGIHKIPFPGTWDEEVQAEITHEEATPVTILALNAEVQ